MKKIFVFIMLMLIAVTSAFSQVEKSNLKVLYVGVNPNKELSERDKIGGNIDRLIELRKTRTADFKQLLKQYFNVVEVVYSEDFKEQITENYDVTIIDDYLKPFAGGYIKDSTGKVTGFETRKYLTKSYNAATIMIGEPSAFIGEGRQLKIDHLCLCLDAHAHGMKLEHPIFNKPYKVVVSYEDVKLTGNYFVRVEGKDLPESMPMLRMQTEGYRDGNGFPIGLVSSGYDFDNGIDAEWISSGTCDKGIEATAIGRHANFFHWGFAAAPKYMTESAKLAFINAIHYISSFKDAKQVTKRIKGTMMRNLLKNRQFTLSDEGSSKWLAYLDKSNKKFSEEKNKIQAKKDRGETLSERDEMMLQMPERKETRAWTIRHEPEDRKEKFGEDWAKYENYYKENMDYFYPIEGEWYKAKVDEDAKLLGIPNNNIKLLEIAVNMLKKGDRTDMAKRILERYTKESFKTSKDWVAWFKEKHKKLFFSEGDGYKFIVLP